MTLFFYNLEMLSKQEIGWYFLLETIGRYFSHKISV